MASPRGIFPDSFSYCFGKPLRTVFSPPVELWTLWNLYVQQGLYSLCNAKSFFFPLRDWWGGKNIPWTICKNICTCLKNLSQTTCPLGSSYGPLVWRQGGPTPLFRDLCAESTQAGTPSEARLVWTQLLPRNSMFSPRVKYVKPSAVFRHWQHISAISFILYEQ